VPTALWLPVLPRPKKKRGNENVPSFKPTNLDWANSLPGNICGNNHGFLLLVVLGEPDFRTASGQFASRRITNNPNLPQEIVAAHAVENKLAVCGGRDTFAGV
jgi:hypothetical protein